VTDSALPEGPSEVQPGAPVAAAGRTGFWIAVGAVGLVATAGLVTFVLVVALGVLDRGALPASAAARALLTAADVRHISGVEIDNSNKNGPTSSTLPAYASRNPIDNANTVRPSACAANIEGWLAWASLDTPAYPGWRLDRIYQASNLVVTSVPNFSQGIQQSRSFDTVAAATAFMNAERGWYRECATASYSDPAHRPDAATYSFSPLQINVGLDSIIEGSTYRGLNTPPHLVDVYLRNRNIVTVLEVSTSNDPALGLDRVSRSIIQAAAAKLRSVG
jgi:hypothetical protein